MTLTIVALVAVLILLVAARRYGPEHISSPTRYPAHTNNPNVPADSGVEPHGLCICDPRPPSSPLGECSRCKRLDPRKAYA